MPDNATSIALIEAFVQAGKPVGRCVTRRLRWSMCAKGGEYLVKGKRVTGFSDTEEETVG